MAMRRFPIDRIDWILSSDPYFAQFPSSIAMRIYLIKNPKDFLKVIFFDQKDKK